MIQIYGKTGCPFCDKAKVFCETRSYNYEYKMLDVDYSKEELIEAFPGARTVPQIKVNGTAVGGYSDFIKYVEETAYNGTGYTL